MRDSNHKNFEAIILGGGAAGLMCAKEAGKRGRRVLVLERAEKAGKERSRGSCASASVADAAMAPVIVVEVFKKLRREIKGRLRESRNTLAESQGATTVRSAPPQVA
ncbi:MAG TPA: FAD-dependent oxidoreductase [Bryobacteraceae bacterium]|nr:FAD-dependent oxidoreductase [Bryobacteraceae bacterium]